MGLFSRAKKRAGTFLGRLAHDRRGNTIAIMAAALVPMAGMVGGGLDMSRMYITKTRLQHACDAGALAGRRSMGGGSWDSTDQTAAEQFFDANYVQGSFGSQNRTRTYTENAGKVSGAASATVPMTLMRILRIPTQTLTVTCDAEMKLPNTDVMFVLDTTGSMNCVAGDSSCLNNGNVSAPGSKLEGLKVAVKCFYQIVAQLDIDDVTCATGEPSGGTSEQVQIRFGFMPYSSNVNVGRLLPPAYFADKWKYQSRKRNNSESDWSDWIQYYYDGIRSDETCPAGGSVSSYQFRNGVKVRDGSNYYCRYEYRFWGPQWDYGQIEWDVSGLKNGTGWNTSLTLPISNNGGQATIAWDGCIEERPTVITTDFDPIPSGAYDLDIDLVPSRSDSNSLWGPALRQVLFYRNRLTNHDQIATAPNRTANQYDQLAGDNCPSEAKKLDSWTNASEFKKYVNALVGRGSTYHDIGMLWGARFLSPDGIFKADNAKAKSGGTIQRHLIFMTDGNSSARPCDYNAYGIPFYDRRQSTSVGDAKNCGDERQALMTQIDLRLAALCKAVKDKKITLWVISYGGDPDSATETRLEQCASPANAVTSTHFFRAKDAPTLQTKFAEIANNISQLRLTQ